MSSDWFRIENEDEVLSPAVLIYPDRIRENIRRMIRIAGGPGRLRPHVKTHKLPEVVALQLEQGITTFKCATLSELEMTAARGAEDVLLAYPLVGPAIDRALDLIARFPETRISVLTDHASACARIEERARARNVVVSTYVDINNGMDRTGIRPGKEAVDLYRRIWRSDHLAAGGLHVYDGHIHAADLRERTSECDRDFEPVIRLTEEIASLGMTVPETVCGGTPTFPVHAGYPDRTVSPGTSILWDYGYGTRYTDMDFLYAAALLTRIVSIPAPGTLCLDLGVKAVASEKPHPRVWFPQLEAYTAEGHSEEHLTISGAFASRFAIGDCLYGIPTHICPTMALHDEVGVVRQHRAAERWTVTARRRMQ